MKALFAAVFMFVVGDFAINHGNGTHQTIVLAQHFAASVSHATSESVFNQ